VQVDDHVQALFRGVAEVVPPAPDVPPPSEEQAAKKNAVWIATMPTVMRLLAMELLALGAGRDPALTSPNMWKARLELQWTAPIADRVISCGVLRAEILEGIGGWMTSPW
jgi:hypothetical protein